MASYDHAREVRELDASLSKQVALLGRSIATEEMERQFPNYVRCSQYAQVDGGVYVEPSPSQRIPSAADERLPWLENQFRADEKVILPIDNKCPSWSTSEYLGARVLAFNLDEAQHKHCAAIVLSSPDAPGHVALIPVDYLHKSRKVSKNGRLEMGLRAESELGPEFVNGFHPYLLPFVLPKNVIGKSLESLYLFKTGKSSTWYVTRRMSST